MKTFPLLLAALLFCSAAPAADWTSDYAQLLQKYVTSEGVRYAAWKQNSDDMAVMQRVVDSIASAPEPQGRYNQMAFYLNAYNAWILHTALEKYPTKTLKFVFLLPGKVKVAGEKMSFDSLEKNVIRKRFAEPRVHFALNCASRSCPPLLAEPFYAKGLMAQLDQLTRDFINSDSGMRLSGNGAELSKIFDWYKDDFATAGGPISFINKYHGKPLPADAKISYQEYNWNLNEAR